MHFALTFRWRVSGYEMLPRSVTEVLAMATQLHARANGRGASESPHQLDSADRVQMFVNQKQVELGGIPQQVEVRITKQPLAILEA